MFPCEFCEALKNTYLRTPVSESVRYLVYIFLLECCLEQKKEYKTEITPKYFDELFVLVNNNITK